MEVRLPEGGRLWGRNKGIHIRELAYYNDPSVRNTDIPPGGHNLESGTQQALQWCRG